MISVISDTRIAANAFVSATPSMDAAMNAQLKQKCRFWSIHNTFSGHTIIDFIFLSLHSRIFTTSGLYLPLTMNACKWQMNFAIRKNAVGSREQAIYVVHKCFQLKFKSSWNNSEFICFRASTLNKTEKSSHERNTKHQHVLTYWLKYDMRCEKEHDEPCVEARMHTAAQPPNKKQI